MRVDDHDWMSMPEAASTLDLPGWRVRMLVSNGHLLRARNTSGEDGVVRASVEDEAAWKAGSSVVGRARRVAGDMLSWGG